METMKKLAIVAITALVLSLVLLAGGASAVASYCTTTVTAPASIQAAVDGASPGDVVCLDDSGGDFASYSTVTFGTSNITLRNEPGDSPVLSAGSGPAFRLADGLSNVTIEGIEIKDRTGFRGGGIEAWDRSTSNITIRDNYIHDNTYSGILVGSEGGYTHNNWMVKNNTVDDNGFMGVELTNCRNCTIKNNDVDPSVIGIVVQARNTVAGSGAVRINGVRVLHNTVDDASYAGIYILSFTGHATNFSPISGASTLLSSVTVSNNTVTNSGIVGIIFWAYNDTATAKNGRIMHNQIDCPVTTPGIKVLQSGQSLTPGTVKNVKVVNNSFDSNCSPQITNTGQDTKLPPGPF
jgi:parallel beta-helix repeat protein